MKISSTDLLNLAVYTQQGQHLGRVASMDIDLDSHMVRHYHVRTGVIKWLWHHELLVARQQVISISKEKMVVEDSLSTKKQPASKAKLATS